MNVIYKHFRFLIDKYGLSQAFWIIGAILSNICVASCVFRQPKSFLNGQDISVSENESDQTQPKSTKSRCGILNLRFALFKNRRFTLLIIAIALCTFGHACNSILIPAHIKTLGYSNTYVTIGVSITGGAELIARIVIGWFADLNIVKKIYIFVICTFVGGIIALISPLFDSFTFMAVYAGFAGAFPASFLALIFVLAIERVGIDNYQPAFAFIALSMALSRTVSLPICGKYYLFTLTLILLLSSADKTNKYFVYRKRMYFGKIIKNSVASFMFITQPNIRRKQIVMY